VDLEWGAPVVVKVQVALDLAEVEDVPVVAEGTVGVAAAKAAAVDAGKPHC
jgi:hypothetical protein